MRNTIHSFHKRAWKRALLSGGFTPPGEPRFFRSPSRNFATAQNDILPAREYSGLRMTTLTVSGSSV
jgi:hypothetical protein